MTHTRPAVSGQRSLPSDEGLSARCVQYLAVPFKVFHQTPVGAARELQTATQAQRPFTLMATGQSSGPRGLSCCTNPPPWPPTPPVRGAPASRGIWKHLKLPRGRPGALRARPHTRLEHCSDPLRELASPMDTAGQSAAWPGHCPSPPGCQMPREPGPPHAPSPPHWPSVRPSPSGVRSADYTVSEQSLLPVADALSLTDGGEVGDCLWPGFQTHCCQALERPQCSSTAALLAFG